MKSFLFYKIEVCVNYIHSKEMRRAPRVSLPDMAQKERTGKTFANTVGGASFL